MMVTRNYKVEDLRPYIDWAYFFYAWQMSPKFASVAGLHQCKACRQQWLDGFDESSRASAVEAMLLVDDAFVMLGELNVRAEVCGRAVLLDANSEGDDILVTASDGRQVLIPCLRQQVVADGKPNLCMADFIRPAGQGIKDRVGIFATTVDFDPDSVWAGDAYRRMMAQTLCDRLAEAAACLLHLDVRRNVWAYAPDESLGIEALLSERNQGIRPAVGYPSLPDQSLNFLLAPLVGMDEMGIRLTENGAMIPHATVSGLMIAHPEARYFAVGRIDETQLNDYATRRRLPVERMRRFLASNLG